MASQKPMARSVYRYSGSIVGGSTLIGVAVGMLQNDVGTYTLFGVGAGLVLSAFAAMASANSNPKG